ncbi:hypothetical protein FO519_007427 [Halicephalobus sp. NKZ332]|nr:hypothetical protein FO519_007427 [Halicephalobus sp. NKZ332]
MRREDIYQNGEKRDFKEINALELDKVSVDSQRRSPANSVSTDHQSDSGITKKGLICVATLCITNLLIFMDRYAIAGVLSEVQDYYDIDDSSAGFLQTVFMVFYLIVAPFSGFLGDRYNRKIIMAVGLIIWMVAVLASTFIPKDYFYFFLFMRGVIGVGDALFGITAPTVIGDLFTGNIRSRVLMCFYFAIPVGSGLGFVVASEVSKLTGVWQWGLRVAPIGGLICTLSLIFLIQEPVRGAAEAEAGAEDATVKVKSSYLEDLRYLISIKTFVFSTIGNVLVTFTTGTLAWWAPTAMLYSKAVEQNVSDIDNKDFKDKNDSSLIFGALTCCGGIIGVMIGVFVAQLLKEGRNYCHPFKTDRADALICGCGSIIAIPFMIIGLHIITDSPVFGWICVFFTVVSLSLNWAIVVDIVLYIVVPRRRNLASALQLSLSHLFGDASGPYIIGLVSDAIRGDDDSPKAHFRSLLDSFYIPSALLLISGVAFFISSKTIVHDKGIFDKAMGYRKKSVKLGDAVNGNVESSHL